MFNSLRNIRDYFLLKRSHLFDEDYYCLQYPDIRLADVNPLWHFVRVGWKEGRNPSKDFFTVNYLQKYPDVRDAGINPFCHYIKFGINEKRYPVPFIDLPITKAKKSGEIPCKQFLDVSIIVPVFNGIQYTQACYRALCNTCDKLNIEIIFVDNASTDGTSEWLRQISKQDVRVSIIQNKESRGFSGAVNQGIVISSGKYISLVNADTIPGVGWLENLIEAMNAQPRYGILSPCTNYPGEGLQIDNDAIGVKADDVDEYAEGIAGRKGIIPVSHRLMFFCVLIRRELVDQIGLLDEGYLRGYFEDDDYCMRTILAGYQLGVVQNAFVYHYGSFSIKENKVDYVKHFEENKKRFFLKASRLSVAMPLKSGKDQKNPLVSVILRTVNRPGLLNNALNSLANQTCQHFEVIIVNDGGPDIPDILEDYKQFLNIQYIHNGISKGRTAALNIGIRQANGEWLCFLDDDDIFYPWFIGAMLQAAGGNRKSNFYYGQHARVLLDPDYPNVIKSLGFTTPFDYDRKELLIGNKIPINTWFVKKATVLEIGGFDETFNALEDYDFILKFSERYPLVLVRNTISEYRFYLSQQNTISNSRDEMMIALSRIYDRYPPVDHEMEQTRDAVLRSESSLTSQIRVLEENISGLSIESRKQIYMDILKLVGAINE